VRRKISPEVDWSGIRNIPKGYGPTVIELGINFDDPAYSRILKPCSAVSGELFDTMFRFMLHVITATLSEERRRTDGDKL